MGQLALKFRVSEDKFSFAVGTALVIQKNSDGTYVLLTAAHLFNKYKRDEKAVAQALAMGKPRPKSVKLPLASGMFLLGRSGAIYESKMVIYPSSVQQYDSYDGNIPAANGGDFAIVKAKVVQSVPKSAMVMAPIINCPEDPYEMFKFQLSYEKDEFDEGTKVKVAGYTTQIKDSKGRVMHYLYESTGKCEAPIEDEEVEDVTIVKALATMGQDGCPAIVNNHIIGVFAGNCNTIGDQDKIYINLISADVKTWLDEKLEEMA